MKASKLTTICALAACVLAAHGVRAQAADKRDDNLDLTMTLLPEHAKGPEDVTKRIALPPPVSADASKDDPGAGKSGHDSGDEGKGPPADSAEQGRDNADQARERGRDFGQNVAEQARENRENAGRGNDPDKPGNGAGGNGNGNGAGGNGNGGGTPSGPPASPPGKP